MGILDQYPVDIVVTDLKVPQIGGLELLKKIRSSNPEISVVVLTQYGTIATAVEATRLGASDYVTKPFHVEELRTKLDRLIHTMETGSGESPAARRVAQPPWIWRPGGCLAAHGARL